MTGPPGVRVRCCYCGQKLGTVTDSPAGPVYRITAGFGGTASGPAGMLCPGGHGYPDLDTEAFRRKLARAPATYRAKMLPAPPAGAVS